ncbi:CBS domain-containing protein [Bowmanella dokdonensis]|uniref:Uncharacterized protein n=1 Tax=Bowmanella dokdonensis TaxID=751969 RepID=A0A939INE1_9ALTE|nr:hypothetical protein [Bowmanella dokdonensis]MBN7826258.1 hypothetical protein [Bowmanella dokdonensis]
MKVRGAKHQGVEWCDSGTSLVDIASLMADKDVGTISKGGHDRQIGFTINPSASLKLYCIGLHDIQRGERLLADPSNHQISRVPNAVMLDRLSLQHKYAN